MRDEVTYKEGGAYYGLVPTCAGSYLVGPFRSRSTARRRALAARRKQPAIPFDPLE